MTAFSMKLTVPLNNCFNYIKNNYSKLIDEITHNVLPSQMTPGICVML